MTKDRRMTVKVGDSNAKFVLVYSPSRDTDKNFG